jgi:hypothetical protein
LEAADIQIESPVIAIASQAICEKVRAVPPAAFWTCPRIARVVFGDHARSRDSVVVVWRQRDSRLIAFEREISKAAA